MSISNYLIISHTPCQAGRGGARERENERAAGVAESSGRIQVSVKPKMLSVEFKEKAEMKSGLLTAD